MAVLIEAISVVIQAQVLEAKFPGGAVAYERECPNATYCRDEYLTRIGFMTPPDVSRFLSNLQAVGLIFLENDQAQDIVVVDQLRGPTAPCDWFAGGRHLGGFSMGWLNGTSPGPLAAPLGWSPSQSQRLTFVPSVEIDNRLLPLGTLDGVDAVLDFATGRQVYVGRPAPPRQE